jgi:hypothetical protein
MATIEKYSTAGGATRYMVRYRTPENTQTKRRGFETKRAAEAFASTVEVAKLTGSYVAPTLGRATVGELGPAWLARQRGHMKPSGWRSYESAWRIHVAPRWESVRIADIRYSDVAAWVAELSARRQVIDALLRDTTRLGSQISAAIGEDRGQVAPALDRLNQVLDMLRRNRASLEKGIRLMAPFLRLYTNAFGSGRWFDAYIQNLATPPQTLGASAPGGGSAGAPPVVGAAAKGGG